MHVFFYLEECYFRNVKARDYKIRNLDFMVFSKVVFSIALLHPFDSKFD